jgi:ferritin-like metal-binding protein YciE
LLAETLEEEKQTDVKLTDLAVGNINKKRKNKRSLTRGNDDESR